MGLNGIDFQIQHEKVQNNVPIAQQHLGKKKPPGVTDLFILDKVFFHLIFHTFSNTLVIFTL